MPKKLIWRNTPQIKKNIGAILSEGFPGGSDGKESACNVGDLGSVSELGWSPGEGNGNPLQYLAWRFPWTEEPGGLQSVVLQGVGPDWATNAFTFTYP